MSEPLFFSLLICLLISQFKNCTDSSNIVVFNVMKSFLRSFIRVMVCERDPPFNVRFLFRSEQFRKQMENLAVF